MPINISDRKIASLYSNLEASPGAKIDDKAVVKMLAEVGDKWFSWSSRVEAQLMSPTMSMDAKINLVKAGMTASEKKDLETILDQGTVPLELSAKNFIESVLGRPLTPATGPVVTPVPGPVTPLPGPTGPVTQGNSDFQVSMSPGGGMSGLAKAGDTIEAINISVAPGGRLHMEDTMVIAKADATGKFTNAHLTGDQEIKEGDLIRMRVRHADGTAGEFVNVKVTGTGAADTRNAVVALFRIGMTDAGNGKINVTNINASRQVSEPGAVLQFTNARTNEKTRVTITDIGGFPDGFTIPGRPGDVFSVASTDGTNNTALVTQESGKITVPGGTPSTTDLIPDPKLHKDELNADGTPKFSTKRFTGPLFVDGVTPGDIAQGQIGDCYFPSAIAALAQNNAEAIENMIKENGDGTYTVTFKQMDWATRQFKNVDIKVDGDLYTRSWGGPLYGASAHDKGEKTMEMFFPLLEKAYATWKGSYNEIGNGGLSNDVFEAVLGREGQTMGMSYAGPDRVWATLTKAIDNKQPVSAGTFGEDQEAKYTNTGVYADHSYSVLGYEEKNGEKYVTLRNPWGESEPAGNGPNDGVFQLKLADFTRLYQTLMYT